MRIKIDSWKNSTFRKSVKMSFDARISIGYSATELRAKLEHWIMDAKDRLTTREVSTELNCRPVEAVAVMRAAGVNSVRCGGAFLWNADDVAHVKRALKQREHVNTEIATY